MSSAATTTTEKQPQNNPFVFILNIPQCLINSFKNFIKNRKQEEKKLEVEVKRVDDNASEVKKADVVSFPLIKYDVPPIKLENDDVVKEDTNPIILWQVYALGGFIILKWAWGKWQERQANAKDDSPDENDPPADA